LVDISFSLSALYGLVFDEEGRGEHVLFVGDEVLVVALQDLLLAAETARNRVTGNDPHEPTPGRASAADPVVDDATIDVAGVSLHLEIADDGELPQHSDDPKPRAVTLVDDAVVVVRPQGTLTTAFTADHDPLTEVGVDQLTAGAAVDVIVVLPHHAGFRQHERLVLAPALGGRSRDGHVAEDLIFGDVFDAVPVDALGEDELLLLLLFDHLFQHDGGAALQVGADAHGDEVVDRDDLILPAAVDEERHADEGGEEDEEHGETGGEFERGHLTIS